ncbi:MAG: cyclic-di-AMP receptor [Dehalococcoidia bacterium]
MSLLLVAVVRDNHVDGAVDALREAGHRATIVPSLGGFLREENSTLLVAIEDEQEASVLDIFARTCPGEEVEVPLVLLGRLKDWRASVVQHAGATIFIVPLQGIVRT